MKKISILVLLAVVFLSSCGTQVKDTGSGEVEQQSIVSGYKEKQNITPVENGESGRQDGIKDIKGDISNGIRLDAVSVQLGPVSISGEFSVSGYHF